MRNLLALTILLSLLTVSACQQRQMHTLNQGPAVPPRPKLKPLAGNASPQLKQMLDGAIAQAGVTTEYDPAYVALEYPGGDVPEKTGVCSDVVVRAFRKAGIDLQKEVHEDIQAARSSYSTKWGSNAPDKNIDHRRVLNLIRMDYLEMPDLRLSSDQARRLWNLGQADCDAVLAVLLQDQFLAQTADGSYVLRQGLDRQPLGLRGVHALHVD